MVSSTASADGIQANLFDDHHVTEIEFEEKKGYSFRNLSKNTNSAYFASKVDRFAVMSQRNKSPAPGTYDVRPSWEKAIGVLPIGTKPTESRAEPRVAPPGPGQYEILKETWDQRAKRRNRKNIMVCTSSRLGTDNAGAANNSPGPGYYDPLPADGGISKRTYNALMNPTLANSHRYSP